MSYKIILLIIFFYQIVSGFAQKQFDKYWIFGAWGPEYGMQLNMQNIEPPVSLITIPIFITHGVTTMCNENGNLLFYSNGCQLANKNHIIPKDGDSLFLGYKFFLKCSSIYISNGVMSLPIKKGNTYNYYLFVNNNIAFYYTPSIFYGGGDAIVTHKIITNPLNDSITVKPIKFQSYDTISIGNLTACQHANGVDWWIINHKSFTNTYKSYLVKEDTILPAVTSSLGKLISDEDKLGQAVFSTDGSKYIVVNSKNGVRIFDFDRCTGKLTSPIYFDIPNKDSFNFSGAAVSPNSQFLYVAAEKWLFQYDLTAFDIESSGKIVAIWDGFFDPYPTVFHQMQLAANGKIYISYPDYSYDLTVIEYPDSLGVACNVKQHAFKLPEAINTGIPNHPDFRLGPLNVNCDSILSTSSTIKELKELKVYPNPAKDYIIFETDAEYGFSKDMNLIILDLNGKVLKKEPLSYHSLFRDIDVSDFNAGMYFWQVKNNGEIVDNGKVVVIK